METLGAPAIGMDSRILLPRSSESGALPDGLVSEEDEVFALAAVVTRNGRIASPEVLSTQLSEAERARRQPAARRDFARAVRAGADGRGAPSR